ncbi:MAG: tetratricopeptide repeat protein [Thermoanaerobaculia bacterium]
MLRKALCSTIIAAIAATAACRPGAGNDPSALAEGEAAIAALEEQIAAGGPDAYVYHEMLAAQLTKAQRTEEAKLQYREALRLRPETGAVYLELSRLEARTGDYDEAVAVAAEGVRRAPENPRLRSWYGEVLMKRGRGAEAEEVLRQTLELADAGAYPRYVLGLVYLNDGKLEQARDELEAATELEANAHEAWYQLANVCERLGDVEGRDRALREFARLYRLRLGSGG